MKIKELIDRLLHPKSSYVTRNRINNMITLGTRNAESLLKSLEHIDHAIKNAEPGSLLALFDYERREE